jgi:enhancing lycopene biosynthesis protein 2
MTTFEIITLAEELKKVNETDVNSIETWIMGGYHKVEAITNEDGYWSVYMDNDNYLVTKSVYSMSGSIADAIDEIIKYIEFKNK